MRDEHHSQGARPAHRSYQLHDHEKPGEGIRRVARGRIDSAVEHLRNDAGADVAEAVHDTRKDMKKLRSLLRLVRDELGPERYRAENGRYRDAARLLSGARDAEVKLATLAALREDYPDDVPEAKAARAQARGGARPARRRRGRPRGGRESREGGAGHRRGGRGGGRLGALERRLRAPAPRTRALVPARAGRSPGGAQRPFRGGGSRLAQAGQGPLVPPPAAPRDLAGGA